MTNKMNLQQVFATNEEAKKVENVVTGGKVVSIVACAGMAVSAFMFGWGLFHRDGSQIAIFGVMTLMCASSFFTAVKAIRSKK